MNPKSLHYHHTTSERAVVRNIENGGVTIEPSVVNLVAIAPEQVAKSHFEISRKDWLSITRIVAAGDYIDARDMCRMLDPQPGYVFSEEIWDDIDIPLIRIIEWLDRLRADRIYLSASVVRIRDEHNYMDSNTTVFNLQEWSNDSELDADVLYRFRNWAMSSGGFKIARGSSPDAPSIDTPVSTDESNATEGAACDIRKQHPEDDEEIFGFDDDDFEPEGDSDTCTCPNAGSGETKCLSTQARQDERVEQPEHLIDRLALIPSFEANNSELLRVQALKKPQPDYGTFLKDAELAELFPEAADIYSVDDIRRALMMIRMILDYGEAAFSIDDGEAVYVLLACILEQNEFWFDGTWSAANPAELDPEVNVSPNTIPDLEFDFEDDDFEGGEAPISTAPQAKSGDCGYRVPEHFEDNSLRIRTLVPDGERRLSHLLSMLESGEFRYDTKCFTQPEEIQVVLSIGAWLLGIDPMSYTTARVLNSLGSIWDLVRESDQPFASTSGGES